MTTPGTEARWHPRAWLLLIAVLPNVNTLTAGFVLDDLPLIVDNAKLHDLARITALWTSGYWPDRLGLTLYRPVTETVWSILWTIGGGSPIPFHLLNVCLTAAVTLLLHQLLLLVSKRPLVAFSAAAIFAVLPIHADAIASVVGSAELLAAVFGTGALIAFVQRRPFLALALYALAVFSKESAAAVAGVAVLIAPKPRAQHRGMAFGAAAIVVAALIARHLVAAAPEFIPPIDNAMALLPASTRILTALWIQCLYLAKSIVPLALSADYSYKQIPLVMGLADMRAWCGIVVLIAAVVAIVNCPPLIARRSKSAEPPSIRLRRTLAASAFVWAILFSATANLLFPIGTNMAERLAFAPSVAIALIAATMLDVLGRRTAAIVLAACVVLYGSRTFVRNRDWHDAHVFYTTLVQTAPGSCKSHYFHGILLASEGDDVGAIREYEQAIAIFAGYSEAYQNRGNALARLGRYAEAKESYRLCLRFDPGHTGAAQNLAALERGVPVNPARRKL